MTKGEVWLFKDGLVLRIVGLDIWTDVGKVMADELNTKMPNAQKADGYSYTFIERPSRR